MYLAKLLVSRKGYGAGAIEHCL